MGCSSSISKEELLRQNVEKTVKKLFSNGITLEQALHFWREYGAPPFGKEWYRDGSILHCAQGTWQGRIEKCTETTCVVSSIIIPETETYRCDYMHSKFMQSRGGPSTPSKLISHCWGNSFYTTLLSMFEDATGLRGTSAETMLSYAELAELQRQLPANSLGQTYWMCIFAVNQHMAICGNEWAPCECGTPHHEVGHPLCQTDKLGGVMELIRDGLVVAVDRKLVALQRCWCVSEIWHSVDMKKPVRYFLPEGIDNDIIAKPFQFKSVENCDATMSSDKAYIVERIRSSMGVEVFDKRVQGNALPALLKWVMLQSVEAGNADLAAMALLQGADVEWVFANGATALCIASQYSRSKVVKLLLETGACINQARAADGVTPLFVSSMHGHRKIVQLLLDVKAKCNQARTTDGATPLFIAAHQGHAEVFKMLMDAGADIDQVRTIDGGTPLCISTQRGQMEIVKLLLESFASVDQGKTDDGATPLYIASQNNNMDVAEALLASGACVTQAKKNGATPLFVSCLKGHIGIVKLLLAYKALIDQSRTEDGVSPLFVACQNGHIDILKMLLFARASMNQGKSDDGATPLLFSAKNGHIDVVKLLVESGAAINQARDNGITPLISSAQKGHVAVVKLLLAARAIIDVETASRPGTLQCAAVKGHVEVVKLLLDCRAPIQQASKAGVPSRLESVLASQNFRNGHGSKGEEIIRLLVTAGALQGYPTKGKDTVTAEAGEDEDFYEI